MFNYSKANLESLNNDLNSTLEECKKLVENQKQRIDYWEVKGNKIIK